MRKITAACLTAAFLAFTAIASFAATQTDSAGSAVSSAAEVQASSDRESPEAEGDAENAGTAAQAESVESQSAESQSAESQSVESQSAESQSAAVDPAMEELQKNIIAIEKVLSSEDFQSLLSYQEVKELVVEVIKRVSNFIQTEPEMTSKILVTAGLNEQFVGPVMVALSAVCEWGDKAGEVLSTQEGQQAVEVAQIVLNDPATQEELMQIARTLEESGNNG